MTFVWGVDMHGGEMLMWNIRAAGEGAVGYWAARWVGGVEVDFDY